MYRRQSVLLLAAVLLALPGNRLLAQQSNNSSASSGQSSSQDSNAFPEAQSEKAAKDAAAAQKQQDQQDGSAPSAPDAPPAQPAKSEDQNPFPEETSRKAADAAKGGSSSSSPASGVSSSSAYDDSVAGKNALPVNAPMRHILPKSHVKEDVQVGSFYLQTGDYAGAYARFKEAAAEDPGSTDAMFGLAQAAQRLHKRDEALTNYQLFLAVIPSGSKAKDARKAVAELERGK